MAFPLTVTAFLSNSIVLIFSLLSCGIHCLAKRRTACSAQSRSPMCSEHSLCLAPLGHCRCYRHLVAGHSGGDCTSPAPPRSSSDRPRPVSFFPLPAPCAYSSPPHLLHCSYVPWRCQGGRNETIHPHSHLLKCPSYLQNHYFAWYTSALRTDLLALRPPIRVPTDVRTCQ